MKMSLCQIDTFSLGSAPLLLAMLLVSSRLFTFLPLLLNLYFARLYLSCLLLRLELDPAWASLFFASLAACLRLSTLLTLYKLSLDPSNCRVYPCLPIALTDHYFNMISLLESDHRHWSMETPRR